MTGPLPDTDPLVILDSLVPVIATASAHIAAQAARRDWTGDLDIASKADPSDFVTEVDREVESRLVGWLGKAYPGIGILAEEGSVRDAGSGRFWLLDPLDGTRNFIKGYPGYCVSLALVEDGRPLLGLVQDVEARELYSAVRGHGSYLGRRRLAVAQESDTRLCVAGVGLPLAGRADSNNLERYLRLLNGTAALRQGGAVARELALLARGSLDAFWQPHLSPWDIAAGMLLVEEAGGQIELNVHGDWLEPGLLGILAASEAAFPGVKALMD